MSTRSRGRDGQFAKPANCGMRVGDRSRLGCTDDDSLLGRGGQQGDAWAKTGAGVYNHEIRLRLELAQFRDQPSRSSREVLLAGSDGVCTRARFESRPGR